MDGGRIYVNKLWSISQNNFLKKKIELEKIFNLSMIRLIFIWVQLIGVKSLLDLKYCI